MVRVHTCHGNVLGFSPFQRKKSLIIIPCHTIVVGYYGFTLVIRSYIRPSVFRFRMITRVNLVCALILWRSGLGWLMGKFNQFLRSYLPKTRPCFRFRTITWVNNKGFSPNLLYALKLRRSDLGLLIGKFRQIFMELSARDMPIFSFPDDNFSK